MGLKEDYRLKKLKKEMHRLHCEITKCCDGEGGDGLSCDDLENCQTIIDIKKSIEDISSFDCEDLENCQEIIDIKDSIPTDVSDLTDDEELLFSGDYNDLDNKPTIPTNNSELVNDSNYLVCEDLENCQEIIDIKDSIPTDVSDLTDNEEVLFSGDYGDLDNKPTIPTNNSELVNDSGYLACDDLENCQEIIGIKNSIPEDISDLTDNSNLLFDGDYDSLSNKPTIPAVNDGQLELNTSGIATGGTQSFSANQSGNTVFTVDVPGTDITLSFNNNILTVSSSTGQSDSMDLSSLATDDTYVTSMSLSGNTLILTNNDNTTVQQDLSSILFDGDYNNLINKPTIPTNTSELVNDSGYLACDDLENCQEIIDIKDSIPTDVSDLTDTNSILLGYQGEHSSAPLSPQKGWFYKNTVDGVMYYFDGANWIAYAEGGGANILIECSLPDLHLDISNSELVPGATYKITGVHKAHTVNGMPVTALYDDGRGLGTTIFLKAVSENKLENSGSGIFYNPNYDLNTQGYGIWSANNTYAANDVVFWGGYAWKNLNGNVGSSVDVLNLDVEWEKLDYTDSNYNEVVDYIEYDIENDFITRRRNEEYNIDVNEVFDIYFLFNLQYNFQYSSISVMNYGLGFNLMSFSGIMSVKINNSYAELVNFKGGVFVNVNFDNGSSFSNVNFDNDSYFNNVNFDNFSFFKKVNFDNGSYFDKVNFDNYSYFDSVNFDNGSYFDKVNFDNYSYFDSVNFDNGSYFDSVNFDNGSRFNNVNFDNDSRFQNVNFDSFVISYSSVTTLLNNKTIRHTDFKGTGQDLSLPDLSTATKISNSDRKEVIYIQGATNGCKLITYDTNGDRVVNDIDE